MLKYIEKLLIASFPIIFISACLTVPPTNTYTINYKTMNIETQGKGGEKGILIVPLSAPSILKQPYIVSKNSSYKIEVLKYDRWESSPKDLVYQKMVDYLFSNGFKKPLSKNSSYYTLKGKLNRFERIFEAGRYYADFEIEIELYSTDPDDDKLILAKKIHKTVPVNHDIESLAKGLSIAAEEGFSALKQSLIMVFKE